MSGEFYSAECESVATKDRAPIGELLPGQWRLVVVFKRGGREVTLPAFSVAAGQTRSFVCREFKEQCVEDAGG